MITKKGPRLHHHLLLVSFAIAQTTFGFYLRRKFKINGDLTKGEMGVAIGLYLLGYFIPGFIYGDIVGPIFNSLGLGI